MRGRMAGMFGCMRDQIMVLIAQFSGPPVTPSRAWPNPFLLLVGSIIFIALITYAILRSRPTLRALLRIAWSVVYGIACVLLIVLWIRSYRSCDLLRRNILSARLEIIAVEGRVKITRTGPQPNWITGPLPSTLNYQLDQPEAGTLVRHIRGFANSWGFGIERGKISAVLVPYWFAVTIAGTFAAAPWLMSWSNRFSLRTLLVATTL
jgi:hypothetical protein